MRKKTKVSLIVAGAALVLLFVGLLLLPSKTDSGVTACQEIADRQAAGVKSSDTMTQEGYVKALAPYESSYHQDLKVAGVAFVNTVWESQKALDSDDTDLTTSLGVISQVKTKYTALQIACAKHGVELKPLTI